MLSGPGEVFLRLQIKDTFSSEEGKREREKKKRCELNVANQVKKNVFGNTGWRTEILRKRICNINTVMISDVIVTYFQYRRT